MEKRSIRRHLADLEHAGLITRQERRGKPSLLIIEDPSEKETEGYLRSFAGPGEDEIVLPTPDKNVRPYKREEKQNLVNEEQARSEVAEAGHEPNGLAGERAPTVVPRAKREYLASEMLPSPSALVNSAVGNSFTSPAIRLIIAIDELSVVTTQL